jgi:hypothetical protein
VSPGPQFGTAALNCGGSAGLAVRGLQLEQEPSHPRLLPPLEPDGLAEHNAPAAGYALGLAPSALRDPLGIGLKPRP